MDYIKKTSAGALIFITVRPGSSKNEIIGPFDGRLKIKIKAPPVEGAANKELIKFLSKTLGLPKSRLELLRGSLSKNKDILVRESSLEWIQSCFE